MTYKTLQTNFERELLLQVITGLRQKKFSNDYAKRIAKAFLPALNSENPDQFMDSLTKMSYRYPEIMNAFIPVAKDYEKEMVSVNLEKVRSEMEESATSSLNALGIIHARVEERNQADLIDSKTQRVRQESLKGGEY